MPKKKQFSFDAWDHNMIPVVPMVVQKRISRWLVLTIASVGMLFVGLVCMDLPLYWTLYDVYQNEHILKMQVARFEELLEKKHALKKEEQTWSNRYQKIEKKEQERSRFFATVSLLKKQLPGEIDLVSCLIDKRQIRIVVIGALIEKIISLSDPNFLNEVDLSPLEIVSIVHQEKNQLYIVTLKGKFVLRNQ